MKGTLVSLLLVLGPAHFASPATSSAPNFVVILGAGAGWTSSSVQMDDRNPASLGTGVKTPNLERLAAAGIRFSDGYAASPRCTPSRAALSSGWNGPVARCAARVLPASPRRTGATV